MNRLLSDQTVQFGQQIGRVVGAVETNCFVVQLDPIGLGQNAKIDLVITFLQEN